jgi:copper transport protein
VTSRTWAPLRPRILAALTCALALLAALPAAAGAHAVLERTTPRWGAVLGEAPRSITLTYDEDVVAHYARVAVVTPAGENLAESPHVTGSVVVVPLRPGAHGSYTVRWHMVAADDGHVTEGAFSFGVRTKALPPAPASGLSVPVAPEALAWLEFLGVVLAGGVLTVRALVLAPAARFLGERAGRESGIAIWVGVAGATLALHAGLFAFLVGVYPIVGGGLANVIDTQIIPIRVGTHLGQAWTVTTFGWLGVLAVLVAAWVTPRRRESLLAAAGLLSLVIAFGISWASHPASRGTLALLADYGHLLAGALWVGGVLALAILAWIARPLPGPARDALFRACLLRFSKLAVPVVAALALAGAYVALQELPSVSALLTSGYGITLIVKTLVFASALIVAGYHRNVVLPRIAAGVRIASVRRTLALEASLLLLALAVAAVLSQTTPPPT